MLCGNDESFLYRIPYQYCIQYRVSLYSTGTWYVHGEYITQVSCMSSNLSMQGGLNKNTTRTWVGRDTLNLSLYGMVNLSPCHLYSIDSFISFRMLRARGWRPDRKPCKDCKGDKRLFPTWAAMAMRRQPVPGRKCMAASVSNHAT